MCTYVYIHIYIKMHVSDLKSQSSELPVTEMRRRGRLSPQTLSQKNRSRSGSCPKSRSVGVGIGFTVWGVGLRRGVNPTPQRVQPDTPRVRFRAKREQLLQKTLSQKNRSRSGSCPKSRSAVWGFGFGEKPLQALAVR